MSFLQADRRVFYIFLFFLLLHGVCPAQSESVPASHPVYPFLKRMSVEGKVKNYDDLILPLSRSRVTAFLDSLAESVLTIGEKERLLRFREYFSENPGSGLDLSYITGKNEHYLYSYKDSLIRFILNPIGTLKQINSNYSPSSKNTSLLIFGGRLRLNYGKDLAFSLQANNGIQYGSRETALLDRRVAQSYTFNHTKINYFDATEGYIRFEKEHFNLQFGRERLLWGASHINRLLLSDNPPQFDFLRFHFSYKKLTYDFVHGWLAHKPIFAYVDSLNREVKTKINKAFAISRLGFRPTERVNLGISQVVVYSGRDFDAGYLNPFLFWESVQRSNNDFDNSLLTFDGRWRVINGLELSAGCIFDDLNFPKYAQGDWAASSNSFGWQGSLFLAPPLFLRNSSLKLDYMQLRPYIFSHNGLYESLNYTNNGYLLGTELQPNSTMLSVQFDNDLNSGVRINALFRYILHGANVYQDSILVKNVGGDVRVPTTWGIPYLTYLLEGDLEITRIFNLELVYEYSYNISFNIGLEQRNLTTKLQNKNYYTLSASINWSIF